MTDSNRNTFGRRTLLGNLGVAAVAGLGASAAQAQSAAESPHSSRFVPAKDPLDAWMDALPGSHRAFIDSSTMPGGANAVRYASNILTVYADDYEGDVSDYAMIVCFRHTSTPYAFNDAIWAKYGALFSRNADPVPTANPMNFPNAANGENTLGALVDRGVHFAICQRATRSYSQRLASATGTPYEQVYAELLDNPITNGRFVPAGVMAATRAQEYGYSLLYAE